MVDEGTSSLNPRQRQTLEMLGAGKASEERPQTPDALAASLRDRLETALAPIAERFTPNRPLSITKHLLSGVHSCQVRFLAAEQQPFTPSVATARGSVTHRALELGINWHTTPLPHDLVDAALDSIERSGNWVAEFLFGCSPADRAQLRGESADLVAKFLEVWPPLTAAMRPATESRIRTELCDRRIQFRGQVDLTLGQAIGTHNRARKIIVDYKTGGYSIDHAADLRFYALIETLRIGVPPRLLVTTYLSTGTSECEPVTPAMLDATVQRVIDGVLSYDAIRTGAAEPALRPSPACRWCPVLDDCSTGQAFLEERDDDF